MRAFCGAASGTSITSMLKREVFGSSLKSLPEQPTSSSPARTGPVPEPYTKMWLLSFGSGTSVCVCERSEEHTSELQSLAYLVCRLLLEKKKKKKKKKNNKM